MCIIVIVCNVTVVFFETQCIYVNCHDVGMQLLSFRDEDVHSLPLVSWTHRPKTSESLNYRAH